MKRLHMLAAAVLVVGAFLLGRGLDWPPPARALSVTLSVLDGGDDADAVECGTTATEIAPKTDARAARSFVIKNASATAVYVGGSTVDTTAGLSVCSSGCDFTNVMPIDASGAYCIVASGTVDVYPTWGI